MKVIPVSEVERDQVVRFVPYAGTRQVTIRVNHVTDYGALVFIHGCRCDGHGVVRSRAKVQPYRVRPDSRVRLLPAVLTNP